MEATGKRHVFLTGARGTGKSALFRAMTGQLEASVITTFAVKEEGVYLRAEEKRVRIGQYDPALGGKENKMRPVVQGMEEGARFLMRLTKAPEQWVCIDEIGYLETEGYQQALLQVLEQKQVLAVVRKQDTPFLTGLLQREDALVVGLDGYDLGCVIMASGLGKRFGGNKLMAPLGGKPVVQWAMDDAKDIFAKTVVVTRHRDVVRLCEEKALPAVLHDCPYRSDTVRLGVQETEHLSGCLFRPGDQPFIMKESLYALVICAANEPDAIWQLGGASPMLFPKWAFAELKALPQGKGGGVLAKKYPDRVRSLAPASDWELRDIDTPQDLACFCAGICCN